jgi:hypothetical protein
MLDLVCLDTYVVMRVKEELQFFLHPHNNRRRKNCSSSFNLITTE